MVEQLAQILTHFHSKNLSLNITMLGKVIFLKQMAERKSLEFNNEDDNLEERYRVVLGCTVDICQWNPHFSSPFIIHSTVAIPILPPFMHVVSPLHARHSNTNALITMPLSPLTTHCHYTHIINFLEYPLNPFFSHHHVKIWTQISNNNSWLSYSPLTICFLIRSRVWTTYV